MNVIFASATRGGFFIINSEPHPNLLLIKEKGPDETLPLLRGGCPSRAGEVLDFALLKSYNPGHDTY